MSNLYGFSKKDVNRIGNSVRTVEGGNGGRIYQTSNYKSYGSNIGEEYAGYFLCTDISEAETDVVKVASGIALINNDWYDIAEESFNISDNCYICLTAIYTPTTYDEFGEILVNGSLAEPTLGVHDAAYVVQTDNYFILVIAQIVFSDSSISNIIQQQYGTIVGVILEEIKDGSGESGLNGSSQGLGGGNSPRTSDYPNFDGYVPWASTGTDYYPSLEWVDDSEDDVAAGGTSTAAVPAQKKKLPILDAPTRTIMSSVCSEGVCGVGKFCKSIGNGIVFAGTKSSVSSRVAYYASSSVQDEKCKASSSFFSGACGSSIDLDSTNSIDGEVWTAIVSLCCCEKDEDDDESEATTCVDNNADCASNDCRTLETATSFSRGSYLECNKAQIGMLSSEGTSNVCNNVDDGNTYLKGSCGYSNLTPCAKNEGGLWDFTYSVCCCQAIPCPSVGTRVTRRYFNGDGGISVTVTNPTDCRDTILADLDSGGSDCAWSYSGYWTQTKFMPSTYHSGSSGTPTNCSEWNVRVGGYLNPGDYVTVTWTPATTFCTSPSAYVDAAWDSRFNIS